MTAESTPTIRTRAGENYLTEQEEKRLFRHLKGLKSRQAERDYVLLKLCRETGLRRAEALALNVGDVRNQQKIIIDDRIARKGATGEVYLSVDMQKILKRFLWLKRTWRESLDDDAPLFVSKRGNRLSIRSFNDLMDKWCREAGIPRYTPHALRHTKAHRIIERADDPRKALLFANRQLRHKSLNSTLIYTVPTKEEMQMVAGL